MIAGYARVSTLDQDFGIQEAALRCAGCDVIRAEKRSGTSREGRVELSTLLGFLRQGDILVVTRVDRLARSIGDLQDIVQQLRGRGVTLRATTARRPSSRGSYRVCNSARPRAITRESVGEALPLRGDFQLSLDMQPENVQL